MKRYFLYTLIFLGLSLHLKAESFRRFSDLQLNLEGQNILGHGLKINIKSPVSMPCTKTLSHTSVGTNFSYNLHQINKVEDFQTKDIGLKKFLINSNNRANGFNFSKLKTFSLLLTLNFEHDGIGVMDDQLEVLDFYKNLLEEGRIKSFFEFCGENFIHSQKGQSNFYVFMTFYAQNKKLEKIIKDGLDKALYNHDPANSFRIKVFENLKTIGYVYLNTFSNLDKGFIPREIGLQKLGSNSINLLIDDIFSTIGETTSFKGSFFEYQSWRNLPLFREYCQSSERTPWEKLGCASGHKYTDLNLMSQELMAFQRRKSFIKFLLKDPQRPEKRKLLFCQKALSKFKKTNWSLFKICLENASTKSSRSIIRIKSCKNLRSQLIQINQVPACEFLRTIKTKTRHFYSDLVSTPFVRKASRRLTKRKIDLGSLFFHDGAALTKNNCIVSQTKETTGESLIKETQYEYYPLKKSQSNREQYIHFKGEYRATSISEALLPSFTLTSQSKEKVKKIHSFFKECGTHYLNQIKRKRGFIINLKIKKNELHLKSHGLSLSIINKLLDPDFKGPRDKALVAQKVPLDIKAYGVSPEVRNHPYFKITNLKDYLRRKTEIVKLLNDSSHSLPEAYSATSWLTYLLGHNLIKRSQL